MKKRSSFGVAGLGLVALGALVGACKESTSPQVSPSATAEPSASASAPAPLASASAAAPVASANAGAAPVAISSAVAGASNAFAGDVFLKLAASPGNVVFSPLSLSMALMMAYGGARGATQAALAKVLHVDASGAPGTSGDPRAWAAMAGALGSAANGPTIAIANRVWAEKTLSLEPPFVAQLRDAWSAPVEGADFKGAAEATRGTINAWVAKQTSDAIKELVPPRALDASTKLVLVDAIWFKGTWATPFVATATKPAPFHLAKGTKNVPMMHADLQLRHGGAREYEAVELPYTDGSGTHELVFDVILPRPTSSLAAVEPLVAADLAGFAKVFNATETFALSLPRFTTEGGADLAAVLSALGAAPAFGGSADFTGIAAKPPGMEGIRLSNVFHRARIQVDETGTQAAAATAIVATDGMGAAPTPKPFVVDRPFLMLLRDRKSGAILFFARVADPS